MVSEKVGMFSVMAPSAVKTWANCSILYALGFNSIKWGQEYLYWRSIKII